MPEVQVHGVRSMLVTRELVVHPFCLVIAVVDLDPQVAR